MGQPISLGDEFGGMLPMVSPDGKYLFINRGSQTCWVDASVIERRRPKQP